MLLFALFVALADPSSSPNSSSSSSSELTDAKADFERGTAHYNLGEFNDALSDYKEAYRKSKLPAFLFNIGQCYYALGDYEKAAFFYEGYLREAPASEHKKEVEGFLAEAKRLLAEQRAKAGPTMAPDAAPTTTTKAPDAAPATKPADVKPVETPAHDDNTPPPNQPVADDAPWLWPTVIGGGVVVVAAAATTIAIVALSQPHGTLPTIDARGGG